MKSIGKIRVLAYVLAAALLSSCASTGSLIASPTIELTGVELTAASYRRQTFLLSFDVHNPNPFPLPIKNFEYRLQIDNERFASGRTAGNFTVPADGADSFAVSVQLDVLKSASHIASLFRGKFRDSVAYELDGRLGVDIPLIDAIPFSHAGTVNMTQTASSQFD